MTGTIGKTTVLFGGSFDPVHSGHTNAVKAVLESCLSPDRVIIMPAFVNPFKQDGDRSGRASAEQRFEMCRLAFEHFSVCTVSDYEISKRGPSYTVDTLEYLCGKYPQDRLILMLGSDSLQTLPMWKSFDRIISLAEVAVVSRSRQDILKVEEYGASVSAAGGTVHIISSPPFDISSTQIRKKIFNNEDISCYVDLKVVKYIISENIYRQ